MSRFYRRPVCEILDLPTEEMEWWACFNSIENNGDTFSPPKRKTSEQDDIANMKALLGG